MTIRPRLAHLALLLALACLFLFVGLGDLGLTDRDEGSNAEAAREMVETGNWISPTLNYEPRFAKPALVYWLMSGAYRTFGVGEFGARFPSAVFGVALVLLHYWFLTRLRGAQAGLLGALMLLLNVEMVAIGRLALTDSVLIFFTTLALYGFWLGIFGEGRERHAIWLLYVGAALATLTKGPVGVLVPLLAIAPYLTITRRWGQFWQRGQPIAGLVVFLLLAVPWYAAMLAIHGSQYTASAQANTIGRFLTAIGGHGGTVLFYIPILFFGFFPWSGFLPAALFAAWRDWRAAPLAPRLPSSPELDLFAALWLIAVFLFFSLSATRLPHYIGPLLPAAAILSASYWQRCLTDAATPGLRASLRLLMGLGYVLGFLLAASPILYARFLDQIAREFPMATQTDLGLGPPVAGVILLIGVGLVWHFGRSEERRAGAFLAAGASIAGLMLVAIVIVLPRFSHYFIKPPQELAYAAGFNLGPQDRLIAYGTPKPSLVFYAKRKVIMIKPGEEERMRAHLGQPGRTMILLPARLRPQVPADAATYPVILQRFGYVLLASEPIFNLPAGTAAPAAAAPH